MNKLIDHLLETYTIAKVTSANINVEGVRLSHKQFIKDYLTNKILADCDLLDVVTSSEEERETFYAKAIKKLAIEIYKEKVSKYQGDGELIDSELDRSVFIPINDLKNGETFLYSNTTKQMSDMSLKAWEKKIPKEELKYVYDNMRDAIFEYDPYNIESFVPVDFEGQQVLKVNTYRPPKWRSYLFFDPNNQFLECPDFIWEVLIHLFPDEKCRKFVIHWLYTALVGRNETYLVLNGKKGIGKGVFCLLARMLVGRENFTEAPDSLLSTHFNSALDKKRIIVMDEFKVGKSEHTKLKRYINKFQNIEKKGVDADKATEIYNSYIIQNNDVTDMYIESDDRRFSVVDISSIPLTKSINKEKLDKLVKRIEEEEERLAYDFGNWIYLQGKDLELDSFSVWRGEKFFELAYSSLYEWKKFLVDKITSREESEYALKSLKREFIKVHGKFSRFPLKNKKIEDFLNNHTIDGETTIGFMEKKDGEHFVICSEEFCPEGNENSVESFFKDEKPKRRRL